MKTDNIGRGVALVAGVISAAGGLAILLDDVVKGTTPFEIKHAITIGIVSLAILAGHSIVAAWRARHVFGVFGFLIVFLAATGLVVFKSTGRQAETTYQSQAEADLAAEKRATIKAALARSEAMLTEAQANLVRECKSGRGPRCKGVEATIGVYEAALTGHRADLDRLAPPKPVAPEAENFANIAAVFGADKARVKAAALLLVPFLTTALFEFGAIVGFAFAFRHHPETRKLKAEQPRKPLSPSEQSDFCGDDIEEARKLGIGGKPGRGNWGNSGNGGAKPTPKPGHPGNGGGQKVYSKAEALLDITRRLASGETVPSQDVLASAWNVNKSTVSKWLKRWREDDLVPEAQRVGRCHRLVAAD